MSRRAGKGRSQSLQGCCQQDEITAEGLGQEQRRLPQGVLSSRAGGQPPPTPRQHAVQGLSHPGLHLNLVMMDSDSVSVWFCFPMSTVEASRPRGVVRTEMKGAYKAKEALNAIVSVGTDNMPPMPPAYAHAEGPCKTG